jgi:hypothetical protein
MKQKLEACGITINDTTINLATRIKKMDDCINNLDLISLSIDSFYLINIYNSLLAKEKTKKKMIIAFYEYYISKDIDCISEMLGKIIAPKEANRFLLPILDLSKIPKIQKDLVNISKNIYMDPITLQNQSLSNVVQLKESGEIMTRDSFDELVRRNTTTWQGKANVGFMSPITNTMIGNPVSFNFDLIHFYPQRPGILRVGRMINHRKIPCTTKPMEIPDYFFHLEFAGYVFYLPDTPSGRKILFIMKDCFKKGNLFGHDRYGRTRHGRVHKKTSLSGGSFGYPDNTYLERVYGELLVLGSSLYTYRHSNDREFILSADPYPDEKRFQIKCSFV